VKQVHINNLNFRFLVKFYTPDPELLEEELTRLACHDVLLEIVPEQVLVLFRAGTSWLRSGL